MQSFLFRSLYLVSPATIMSAGSYYTYSYFWPKKLKTWLERSNVKWISTSDDTKDKEFKAMFNDNKSQVSKLNEDDLNDKTAETDAVSKLKKWCKDALDKDWSKELEDLFLKFCVHEPKTVRGLFISNGKDSEIIGDDDDYKVVFTLYYKGGTKYNTLINGLNSSTDVDAAKDQLKTWCKSEFDKNLLESNFKNQGFSTLFDLCTKPGEKTVEKRIKKAEDSWTKMEENGDEQWKSAFDEWKNTEKFINAVKKDDQDANADLSSSTSSDDGYSKMKNWCKKGLEKKIYDDNIYPEEYVLLKSACKKKTT